MSTSERAFDKVKTILGKMDRNIDAARERRLSAGRTPPVKPTPLITPQSVPAPGAALPADPAKSRPSTPGSVFGRATPIRSSDR